MKKLPYLLLSILSGCTYTNSAPEVFIGSNVSVGGYYTLNGKTVTLSKDGYIPVTIKLDPEKFDLKTKTHWMSTTSGDESLWAKNGIELFSENNASISLASTSSSTACGLVGGNDKGCENAFVSTERTYAGTTGIVFLPTYLVGLSVPYRITEYERGSYYFWLFEKNDENEKKLEGINRFILTNFKTPDRTEFLKTLSQMTKLSEKRLTQILKNNPAPDLAANAVVAEMTPHSVIKYLPNNLNARPVRMETTPNGIIKYHFDTF